MVWEVVKGEQKWKPVEVPLGEILEKLYQDKKWKKTEIGGSDWVADFTNPKEVATDTHKDTLNLLNI